MCTLPNVIVGNCISMLNPFVKDLWNAVCGTVYITHSHFLYFTLFLSLSCSHSSFLPLSLFLSYSLTHSLIYSLVHFLHFWQDSTKWLLSETLHSRDAYYSYSKKRFLSCTPAIPRDRNKFPLSPRTDSNRGFCFYRRMKIRKEGRALILSLSLLLFRFSNFFSLSSLFLFRPSSPLFFLSLSSFPPSFLPFISLSLFLSCVRARCVSPS